MIAIWFFTQNKVMNIEFGYCCISRLCDFKCNSTTTKTYIEKMDFYKRKNYILQKVKNNLENMKSLLEFNAKNNIRAFRISDQTVPHLDLYYYDLSDIKNELLQVGEVANKHDLILSIHPSQYFVLNSNKKSASAKAIENFDFFADIFSHMQLKNKPTIVTHVGACKTYETKDLAKQAFVDNFYLLSKKAQDYLAVENDHNAYFFEDCLEVSKKIGIPTVFDNRHYHFNKSDLSFDECVKLSAQTWVDGRFPKFHLSSDNEMTRHAHAEYVENEDFLELKNAVEKANIDRCIFMFECKGKDLAVEKIRNTKF